MSIGNECTFLARSESDVNLEPRKRLRKQLHSDAEIAEIAIESHSSVMSEPCKFRFSETDLKT